MEKASNNDAMMISSTDNDNDIITMADCFRSASDDDTRKVMNVMANQTATALESLKLYAVTKSWFLRAWPILTAKPPHCLTDNFGDNLRDYIGKINNSELVLVDTTKSNQISIDEDAGVKEQEGGIRSDVLVDGKAETITKSNGVGNHLEFHRSIPENPETIKLKPGLVHTKDYFFLGKSAWLLVKEKFGYDGYEICRSCKNAVTGNFGQGVIAVALLPGEETVPPSTDDEQTKILQSTVLPVSGRFQYEKLIPSNFDSDVCMKSTSHNNNEEIKNERFWTDDVQKGDKDETEYSDSIILLPPTTPFDYEPNSDDGEFFNGGPFSEDASAVDIDRFFPSSDNSKMEIETIDGGGDDDNTQARISGRKRLASGLSNMGNTCFMNSTLQCLAHTENLRRYFLSGEYKKDLNRDNPLGTGGELATQFASLMVEMWSEPSKRRNVIGGDTQNWKYSNLYSQAVYPRSFKNSLGTHAEQFMGYDQHDSQELATYLLDALHEDTNRVTKKPYVEKPEQGENEPDADAADTAWKMHLRREDSKVLENFMGQVKSRLECCEEGCNRVSTTFDPFMYLSVPIPSESERTMTVIFVPIDPDKRMQKLTLTIAKTATITGLLEAMNEELLRTGICVESVPLHDLCAVEVYNKEIFKWHEHDDEIDGIKDFDKTFVYQLRSLEEIKRIPNGDKGGEDLAFYDWSKNMNHRVKLDSLTLTELNKGDRWKSELEHYSKQRFLIYKILNASRSSVEDKIEYYKKMEEFLNECYVELEKDEASGSKRTREDDGKADGESVEMHSNSTGSEKSEKLTHGRIDCSSTKFPNVRTRHDVGVLEFCANKLRQFIFNLIQKSSKSILIQVGVRQSSGSSTDYSTSRHGLLSTCLVLRLPGHLSVYGLREELAHRLSRSLVIEHSSEDAMQQTKPGELTAELSKNSVDKIDFKYPEINILQKTRLSFDNSGRGSNYTNSKSLGMLGKIEDVDTLENGDKSLLAIASDEEEQTAVATKVKNHGHVYLDLEQEGDQKVFDAKEFDLAVVPDDNNGTLTKEPKANIAVKDCIENYCKKEQLEESEMWYCNKCKKTR